MRIRPRGAAEDCCCSSLNDKVKWLMERIGGTVRKIIINGSEYTPDGDGTVTLDTGAFVDVDDHLDDDSMKPIANKPVAEAIEGLQDADSVLDGKITTNTSNIEDLEDDVETLEAAVLGHGVQISDLQGSIAGLAADNSYTRGLAQAAKDTADGMAERLTDLETNDAVQQSQIGQLIVADQANAKLAGDNAFTGQNSFAVNPKAAAPASGAVDTSVVNANWASQTGDDAPNNLSHRYGNETEYGIKTSANRHINAGFIRSGTTSGKWYKVATIPKQYGAVDRTYLMSYAMDNYVTGKMGLFTMSYGASSYLPTLRWLIKSSTFATDSDCIAVTSNGNNWELWLKCTTASHSATVSVIDLNSEVANQTYSITPIDRDDQTAEDAPITDTTTNVII